MTQPYEGDDAPKDCYCHPQEIWDEAECRKRARHLATDGLGTPYGFRGYIGSSFSVPPKFGTCRWNGGCCRPGPSGSDKWYPGEFYPKPAIHEDYEIVHVPTWGWRIKLRTDNG